MSDVTEHVVYRTREMQRLEARYGKPMDVILRELYVEQGLFLEDVGKELGITKGAVSRWLVHFGIPARRGGPVRETAA